MSYFCFCWHKTRLSLCSFVPSLWTWYLRKWKERRLNFFKFGAKVHLKRLEWSDSLLVVKRQAHCDTSTVWKVNVQRASDFISPSCSIFEVLHNGNIHTSWCAVITHFTLAWVTCICIILMALGHVYLIYCLCYHYNFRCHSLSLKFVVNSMQNQIMKRSFILLDIWIQIWFPSCSEIMQVINYMAASNKFPLAHTHIQTLLIAKAHCGTKPLCFSAFSWQVLLCGPDVSIF